MLHSLRCEAHLIYYVQAVKIIRTQGIKLLGAGCWAYICGELRAYSEFAVVGFEFNGAVKEGKERHVENILKCVRLV